jgi:hypothetical protein
MSDNFNLRTFLSENELTKNSQLIKEQEGFKTFQDSGIEGLYMDTVNGVKIYSATDSSVSDYCAYVLEYPDGKIDIVDLDVSGQPISSEELQEYDILSDKPEIADFISRDIDKELGFEQEGVDEYNSYDDKPYYDDVPKSNPSKDWDSDDAEYIEDDDVEEAYQPKSKLEQVIQQAWAEKDLQTAKQLVLALIEPSKVKSKDIIVQTIKGINNKPKLDQYLANSLLKFEKLGLNEDQDEYLKGDLTVFSKNENTEETWKKGGFYSRDYVERTYPDKVKEIEGNIEDEEDRNPNIWDLYTSLETPEEVEDFIKDYINEGYTPKSKTTNKLTTRERRLVEMVQRALGEDNVDYTMGRQNDPNQLPNPAPKLNIPQMTNDEIVEEKPLPTYESVEDLMKEIEHGTNKAMYEYKISEMKRIAKQLEEKVNTLEESELSAHINPADVKKMKKDILTLHKGVSKIEKEYDRKFNKKTKTSEPKAEKQEVALAENRRKRLLKSRILSENRVSLEKRNTNTNTMENFDLKKFLVENKLTANSRVIKEYIESDPETITQAFQEAGVDLSAPTEMEIYYGHDGEEKAFATGQEALSYLEGLRAEAEAEDPNFNTESGIAYDYGENVADLYEGDGTPKLLVSFGDSALYIIAQ